MTPQNKRQEVLTRTRNIKMARSPHAFVRGNTIQFYKWLSDRPRGALPEGPPIWICGDCHVGNLGPVANADGHIRVQIRDLDQTVIGNPAHDLIRLGLSLASAARGSDLPGVTTARMIESLVDGYEQAFDPCWDGDDSQEAPTSVRQVVREANRRTWKQLAKERIKDTSPDIPLGKKFWPLAAAERGAIMDLFDAPELRELATSLHSRDSDATVKVVDAAFWMKGCSSLGLMRYAVLLSLRSKGSDREYCLMDVKEAVRAAAPHDPDVEMPRRNGQRIVEGARKMSPYLGERMRSGELLGQSIFVRELLPQDLKLEIEQLTSEAAVETARYLATIVGHAHARQMDRATRKSWQADLQKNRTKSLDAPSWLWSAIVNLLMEHEGAYLEHCRKFSLAL
jgi:uncharacterized protein (DUF2252 family)